MQQWMQDLTAGWPMIRANLPTFFVILVLIILSVWAAVNWSYSGVLASKNGQIELQDRQLADYKEKLSGATPDQARARIDALEARLAAVEPRRLTAEQRTAMKEKLLPQPGTTPSIAIIGEASGDSPQFAADIASVFHSVSEWKVGEGSVMGIGNRPASGVALKVANMNSAEAFMIGNALRAAKIDFDIKQAPMRDGVVAELLICTRIVR